MHDGHVCGMKMRYVYYNFFITDYAFGNVYNLTRFDLNRKITELDTYKVLLKC